MRTVLVGSAASAGAGAAANTVTAATSTASRSAHMRRLLSVPYPPLPVVSSGKAMSDAPFKGWMQPGAASNELLRFGIISVFPTRFIGL